MLTRRLDKQITRELRREKRRRFFSATWLELQNIYPVFIFIALTIAVLSLGGCQSTQTVVQRVPCLLPDDLKQRDQMSDHPEVEIPAVPDGGEAWAKDRAKGAEGWKRHNDTVDFVERECQ